MSSHHALGEQLSERVQRLANFADAHCSEDELLMLLVRAIREQQAALEKMLYDFDESDCEYDGDLAAVTNARAVLEKWRIE